MTNFRDHKIEGKLNTLDGNLRHSPRTIANISKQHLIEHDGDHTNAALIGT